MTDCLHEYKPGKSGMTVCKHCHAPKNRVTPNPKIVGTGYVWTTNEYGQTLPYRVSDPMDPKRDHDDRRKK